MSLSFQRLVDLGEQRAQVGRLGHVEAAAAVLGRQAERIAGLAQDTRKVVALADPVGADMDSYYDFHVNKLSQAENVGNIQSVFVMGVIKESMLEV